MELPTKRSMHQSEHVERLHLPKAPRVARQEQHRCILQFSGFLFLYNIAANASEQEYASDTVKEFTLQKNSDSR